MNRIVSICILIVVATQLRADDSRYGNEAIISNDVITIHVASDMLDLSTLLGTTNHYCTIHQQELCEGTAEVQYGLIIPKEGYQAAEETVFPYAADCVLGGCAITDNSPKSQKVLYCPRCRQAKAEWEANHNQ